MAKNIEIKAHIKNLTSMLESAASIADHGPEEIDQDDTFFNCQNGRLKLRVLSKTSSTFSTTKGQLVFYQRPDRDGPKESFYVISPTTSPETLLESLTLAYGVAGRVRKKRILFLVGRTRIHVDQVEGLGDFVELEVVLGEGESADRGIAESQELMEKLSIDYSDLIEGAYVDLIAQKSV